MSRFDHRPWVHAGLMLWLLGGGALLAPSASAGSCELAAACVNWPGCGQVCDADGCDAGWCTDACNTTCSIDTNTCTYTCTCTCFDPTDPPTAPCGGSGGPGGVAGPQPYGAKLPTTTSLGAPIDLSELGCLLELQYGWGVAISSAAEGRTIAPYSFVGKFEDLVKSLALTNGLELTWDLQDHVITFDD